MPLHENWSSARAAGGSAGDYVAIGAATGALATVAGLVIAVSRSNNEFLASPLIFAPYVAGAAVVGGVFGFIVYKLRSDVDDRSHDGASTP